MSTYSFKKEFWDSSDTVDYPKFKLIIIGSYGAGKTTLINRFVDDSYDEVYSCTIGVDFKSVPIQYNNKKFKLYLWDTAGHEKFKTLVTNYFRNSDIVLITFDLTNAQSFLDVKKWYSLYKNSCMEHSKHLEILLVGTKSDNKLRVITNEQIVELCEELDIKYFEISSKKNIGVHNLFNYIIDVLYNNYDGYYSTSKTLGIINKTVLSDKYANDDYTNNGMFGFCGC